MDALCQIETEWEEERRQPMGVEEAHLTKREWTVSEARAKLSEVIQRAEKAGPQGTTRRGKRVAVVVSAEEWQRKTKRKENLADFFARSPLRGSGLDVARLDDEPRGIRP